MERMSATWLKACSKNVHIPKLPRLIVSWGGLFYSWKWKQKSWWQRLQCCARSRTRNINAGAHVGKGQNGKAWLSWRLTELVPKCWTLALFWPWTQCVLASKKEFACTMRARRPTSAMPKSFLCCERAFCRSKMGQVRHCLWPDRNLKFAGPRTEPSNSPDLTAYGRTEPSNSPDLTAYGRTVRHTYVHPAGPPCLWPDRTPALGLTKLVNGGRGCSRRKHGYSRILLHFNLPLALYARVSSKPGEMWWDVHPMFIGNDGFLPLLSKYLRRCHLQWIWLCSYWIRFTKHILHGMIICNLCKIKSQAATSSSSRGGHK